MNLDINHLVRSGAIALVGTPLALSTSGLINTTADAAARTTDRALDRSEVDLVIEDYGDQLAKACIEFAVSKSDTKLEREAKNTIDEVMGGEVNHGRVCDAFVF